ncbi:ricin B lectin domain-containing protein [Amanita rubescens]|nr:ricin B lectin domain-containing protein [Amanita rubescens]
MFKSFSFLRVGLLTAALVCNGVFAQAPVASISSAQSSKCLAVRGSKFVDGTHIVTNDCDNSTSQQWEIFSGLTEVKLADPGLAITFCVDAKTVDEASPVVLWECNQNYWQQWIFTDDGLLTLANNTNLCLEVPNPGTSNIQVKTSACNGALNQVWNLV